MADPTLRGSTDPFQQWLEESYDPSSGYTRRLEFRGLSLDKMLRTRNYYTAGGCTAVLRHQFGVSTLTITDPTRNELIDKWELGVDEERPSIFENPLFLDMLAQADVGGGDSRDLLTGLKKSLEQNDDWGTFVSDNLVSFGDVDDTLLRQYFTDYQLGVTNYLRGKYALRHTTNAPSRWDANIADFNVERIYTIAQLLNEVQSRSLWILPLPGYLAYKILNYEVPASRSNYMWGALKKRSNAVTTANNRVDITTEYLIDAVNTNLYSVL